VHNSGPRNGNCFDLLLSVGIIWADQHCIRYLDQQQTPAEAMFPCLLGPFFSSVVEKGRGLEILLSVLTAEITSAASSLI